MEARLIIAYLVHQFEFSLAPPYDSLFGRIAKRGRPHTLSPKKATTEVQTYEVPKMCDDARCHVAGAMDGAAHRPDKLESSE
eukprot:60975-Amphidinium_carterae.1